jgi:sulfur carrier protein
MNLIVNGEAQTLAEPASVQQLLESLDLAHKRVAVELNGDIVPRSRHQETALQDGDEVLIVQAIGGG